MSLILERPPRQRSNFPARGLSPQLPSASEIGLFCGLAILCIEPFSPKLFNCQHQPRHRHDQHHLPTTKRNTQHQGIPSPCRHSDLNNPRPRAIAGPSGLKSSLSKVKQDIFSMGMRNTACIMRRPASLVLVPNRGAPILSREWL